MAMPSSDYKKGNSQLLELFFFLNSTEECGIDHEAALLQTNFKLSLCELELCVTF